MGGPNDSTSSSKGLGRKNPAAEQKWHPGRVLCYTWKKEHTYLAEQVEHNSIIYNTQFDLGIEHCTMEKRAEAMSLRPSMSKDGKEYSRYKALVDSLQELVDSELSQTETGEPMWKIEVHANDKKRTLLPRDVPQDKRKARTGSFEVILSWTSAGVLGSRQEVVLFSKLNTLKFPNPPDIVAYLKRVLAPARMLAFQLHVRSVPEGLPYVAAVAEVDVGEDEPVCNDTDKKGCVALRLPFGKDFTAIVRRKPIEKKEDSQIEMMEDSLIERMGTATFDVHGDMPKSICTPLVPQHIHGEVRVVLSWGEFPHDLVLKVKTPEGTIQTPGQKKETQATGTQQEQVPSTQQEQVPDTLQGKKELPNAEYECSPAEGGFGPISVLLRALKPGRYHVYAKCTPYDYAGKRLGWADSNAQIVMYGHEQEQLNWKGDYSFVCKKEGDASNIFWDVCFFDVSVEGHVTVSRVFNDYVDREPGFRDFIITCKDMQGKLVPNATVKVDVSQAEAYKNVLKDFVSVTDKEGKVSMKLPLGEFTATVTHDDYLPNGATIVVDLDPEVAEATVAMVKEEYFAGTDNKLVVLTWGGPGRAVLHVETPGRLFAVPETDEEEASYNIMPSTTMKMRGTNPRGCMLTPPDKAVCPWADPEGAEHSLGDQIFVEYEGDGPMDKTNMQLTIFTKDGIIYYSCPKMYNPDSTFWRVCEIKNGRILEQNTCVVDDPTSGDVFSVRIFTSKEADEAEEIKHPSPEVIITREGDTQPVRTYLGSLQRDDAEFTQPLEYKLFMPFGVYDIETKDESWIMRMATEKNSMPNLPYKGLYFSKLTSKSAGLCMASQEDIDARSCFISLTWADQPKDLDLCIAHSDGVVSSHDPQGKGIPKGVTYVTAKDKGFGPKVISIQQPISAKFKVYVMDRSKQDPKIFLKSHPMVNITFFNQIWQSFTVKIPEGDSQEALLEQKMESGKSAQCCWHVCDLKIEQDTKMSENCVECVPINELLDAEVKFEAS